jgi:endonuclease-3 related protein
VRSATAAAAAGFAPDARSLHALLDRLLDAYGPQHWWPGETPFEVMVGAVLTQNTAWGNVERAIANLKAAGVLTPESIVALPHERLAALIRPAGYFNVKARRLRSFCEFLVESGGEPALADTPTGLLRARLLAVHGIGPETADDILLYAFGRPVFVIDAYTRRLFGRLGLASGQESYEDLRTGVERAIGPDPESLNELHALIVHHAKVACAKAPRCGGGPPPGRIRLQETRPATEPIRRQQLPLISASDVSTRLRPPSFARYRARSARLNSASALSPARSCAPPMLTVTRSSRPPTLAMPATLPRIRSASCRAPVSVVWLASTTNSSPP